MNSFQREYIILKIKKKNDSRTEKKLPFYTGKKIGKSTNAAYTEDLSDYGTTLFRGGRRWNVVVFLGATTFSCVNKILFSFFTNILKNLFCYSSGVISEQSCYTWLNKFRFDTRTGFACGYIYVSLGYCPPP